MANNEERAKGRFVKQRDAVIKEAWQATDNGRSFARALEEQGYVLARGDRRAVVVIDPYGRTINPARQLEGVKVKDLRARLSDLDLAALPGTQDARKQQEERLYFDREAWAREQDRKNTEAAIAAEQQRQAEDKTRRTERQEGAQADARRPAPTAKPRSRPARKPVTVLTPRSATSAAPARRASSAGGMN